MAFGVRGSFYRDSKFLHFFVHKCKLHTIKQKMMSLLYIQLYKHIKLFKSYISRFLNTALFSRLKSKLFRLVTQRYKYRRSKLVLHNKLQATDLERFFTFFNTLGKVHVQYVSQLRPVVKQCISYAQYAELSSNHIKLSYERLNAPHWRYAKVRHHYRSALLHYFTKNMLLAPDMFTIYGNNVLIFSVRNTKLHLCADYYGNAINEFLLNRKIADFFSTSDKYTDFADVK